MDYDFYEEESAYFIEQAYKLIKQQDIMKKSSYTGDNPCGSQSNIAYLRYPYHLKISDNGRLSLIDCSKKGYNRVISHSRNNVKSEQISCIGKLLCVYIDNIKSFEKEDIK